MAFARFMHVIAYEVAFGYKLRWYHGNRSVLYGWSVFILGGNMSEFSMEKTYNPKGIERETYQRWEESGAFAPVMKEGKKPFTIVMPPPNITGQLHMGHAMDCVLQDSLIRYHRMKGDPTLYLPGTDHASIATEVKIVEKLAKEGHTKEMLGREGFLERAWEWKKEYGGKITKQLRYLGASCDWSRERFTMDEGCSKAVNEVFVKLYEEGLIYRGNRIINWCPNCLTALSDAEVEYEEEGGHLWYIRYSLKDGSDSLVVATTRPETMLGDTGVAVNPEDERYRHFIGRTLLLPLVGREIPVVADSYVDASFGTGAVKMTPAHDPNDFEVGLRHQLPLIKVMNDDGTMNEHAGKFAGLSREEARKAVLSALEKEGALVKTENYTHNVGHCYRCATTVEPIISKQWFVKMQELAEPAIETVKKGETKFLPERFSKIYFNWMENIRDWCISRQLWWGHRIPAWYCDACGETIVAKEAPVSCTKCGCKNLKQDEDVLDTWFSSALWPFSTLGWPEKTKDFETFYPTSTLVTGHDIIFFWVARMIFSGLKYTGKTPFDTVLIHGLVRDDQGRKMSKSLGNGVDPLEIIEEFGADALRFSLCMGVSPGNDTRTSKEKVESARNFANKIWNAARFVISNLDGKEELDGKTLSDADKWILHRCMAAIGEMSDYFERCEHGLAAQKIYDFAWSDFCDWYIELAKSDLFGENLERKRSVRAVLHFVLEAIIKMLHPFMPFISEEIYKILPGNEGKSCMLSAWPKAEENLQFAKEAKNMDGVMEVIRQIRNLRANLKVKPGARARLLVNADEEWADILRHASAYFERQAGVSSLHILDREEEINEQTVSAVFEGGEFFIPLGELVDISEEIQRLKKEKEKIEGEIMRAQSKLSNEGFVKKAPPQLIEQEKEKLSVHQTMLESISKRILELSK